MTRSPDAARLVCTLERFRTRLRRLLALRTGITAITVAIVSAEALAWWTGARLVPSLAIAGVLAAAAVLAASVIAVLRTPSLQRTAQLLDAREALQNRATTALQFIDHHDAISVLVVRDASTRVAALDPVLVFQREYPACHRVLLGLVAVSSIVFAVVVFRTGQTGETPTRRAGGIVIPGAPAQARSGTSSRPAGSTPAAAPRSATVMTPVPGTTSAASGERPASAPVPPVEQAAATGSPVPPEQGRGTDSGAAVPSHPPPAAEPGVASSVPSGANATATHPTAGGTRAPSSARDGTAAGGVTAVRSTAVGGGVKDGAVDRRADDAGRRGPGPRSAQSFAVEYQAAWLRAQAAIAQDRVPPELREYVRRYFAAIRTPRQP